MKMIIHQCKNKDKVYRFDRNIVIPFEGKRKVLSTAPHNGGYREDLKAVFNHDGCLGLGVPCKMNGDTFREHMMNTIREMGLDVETTTGMETAARMENASVKENSFDDLTVAAIVTAGITVNGGRVGDPTDYVEDGDVPEPYRIGTINIILHIDADMSPGAITRALVTCTEAKTVAVEELQIGSKYSRGLATGSGTDGTIIVANPESKKYLTGAGKHCKLGELIGITVRDAVKEALYRQSFVNPEFQHNGIFRMERFGVLERDIYHKYVAEYEDPLVRPVFSEKLDHVVKSREGVVLSSILAHLIDQMDWDLISIEEAKTSIINILHAYGKEKGLDIHLSFSESNDKDQVVHEVVNLWKTVVIEETLKVDDIQ